MASELCGIKSCNESLLEQRAELRSELCEPESMQELIARCQEQRAANLQSEEQLRAMQESYSAQMELGDQQTCLVAEMSSQNDCLAAELRRANEDFKRLQDRAWGSTFCAVSRRELEAMWTRARETDREISALDRKLGLETQEADAASREAIRAMERLKELRAKREERQAFEERQCDLKDRMFAEMSPVSVASRPTSPSSRHPEWQQSEQSDMAEAFGAVNQALKRAAENQELAEVEKHNSGLRYEIAVVKERFQQRKLREEIDEVQQRVACSFRVSPVDHVGLEEARSMRDAWAQPAAPSMPMMVPRPGLPGGYVRPVLPGPCSAPNWNGWGGLLQPPALQSMPPGGPCLRPTVPPVMSWTPTTLR